MVGGGTDAYAVLGISPDASDHQVRVAYVELARRTHPDRGGPQADGAAFRRVLTAYQALLPGDARRAYDLRRRGRSGGDVVLTMGKVVYLSQCSLEWSADDEVWLYGAECRCGCLVPVARADLRDGAELFECPGCSLWVHAVDDCPWVADPPGPSR